MKRKLTYDQKRDLIQQKVKVSLNGLMTWGYISGTKLDFPVVYVREFNASFEISWDLAYRAAYEGVTINA